MPHIRHTSKRKRPSKTASVLGLAGVSLTATAAGSAAALPSQLMAPPYPAIFFDEELSDVSLATFHVFDLETSGSPQLGIQLARGGCGCGHGGGGHGGCGHAGGGHFGGHRGHVGHGGWHGGGHGGHYGAGWHRGGRGCGGCGCGFGGCGCAGGGGCCLSWGGCWPSC
jgi:hypothetical protein